MYNNYSKDLSPAAFVLLLHMFLCVYMYVVVFVCVYVCVCVSVSMYFPTKILRHPSVNQQAAGKYIKMDAGIPEEYESTKLSGMGVNQRD